MNRQVIKESRGQKAIDGAGGRRYFESQRKSGGNRGRTAGRGFQIQTVNLFRRKAGQDTVQAAMINIIAAFLIDKRGRGSLYL